MTLRNVLLSGLVAGVLASAVPALAATQASQARFDRAVVNRSFQSVLHRQPRAYEMRRYVKLMNDYGWTEQDVRKNLAGRSDYRRYSADPSLDVDGIVTRAFEDILGRRPDAASMQSQRTRMTRQGWSERDVRENLRQRPEYRSSTARNTSADRIITRAYQDILKREPDPSGMATYRRAIIEDGWDEQDLRQVLQNSQERRGMQGDATAVGGQDNARVGQQSRGTSRRGQN
jgi:hypothetical protein